MTSRLLDVQGLTAGYGGAMAVRDISLHVRPGEIVALLGPNGAGKSTTLSSIAGVLPPSSGTITYRGQQLRGPLHRRARAGISLITERRAVTTTLSVARNLQLGLADRDAAMTMFPELAHLRNRPAGLLSGGEQQILTLGRALSCRPALLLIDELSLGLAPLIVSRLLERLRAAADDGVGVLLVEQHAHKALQLADRGYVIGHGAIQMEGTGAQLRERIDEIQEQYFHVGGGTG